LRTEDQFASLHDIVRYRDSLVELARADEDRGESNFIKRVIAWKKFNIGIR